MTDMTPVHQGNREIHNIVRSYGKQIRGHELGYFQVAFTPVLLLAKFGQFPFGDRQASRLLLDHTGHETTHTLIVRPPADYPVAEGRQATVVRLIDVAPTILDFLGIKQPRFWEGQSLLPLVRGEEEGHRLAFGGSLVYYQERKSIREGRHKYILTPRTGEEELYDLEADPLETVNLAGREPDLAARLRATLERHLEEQRELAERFPSLVTAEDEVDDRHIEELKALGYVQ